MATKTDAVPAIELPAYYYRDNFIALCETVEVRYGDLLLPCERELLAHFGALDHASQCLYVRLASRVGPLFRVDKLTYPEIGALEAPLRRLAECGLITIVEALNVPELGANYTKTELTSAFAHLLDTPAQCRKDLLLQRIEALHMDEREHFSLISVGVPAPVVRFQGEQVVQLLQMLFFGNLYQSLTDFILSDLGVATYYPYTLDSQYRLFCSRAAIDEYLACGVYREDFGELLDSHNCEGMVALGERMLAHKIQYSSSIRRWDRLCNALARELERNQEAGLAAQLYGVSRSHPSRERVARIRESQQDWQGALECCEGILREPWCEAELEAANRISTRVLRKLHGKATRRVSDCFDEEHFSITPVSGSVERDTANFLAANWTSVHYLENSLMNTLFGLAFWEQIFADLPGAFHNPFQSIPTDMYDAGFSVRRKDEIAARLEVLRQVDLRTELTECYQRFEHFQCRWLDWQRVDLPLLTIALERIPAAHLFAIWERQLFDPRENRNGFPDLVAFGDRPGDYCMIEVKGPGDRLQDNQKRWLRYFAGHNIPAKVAWVEWSVA